MGGLARAGAGGRGVRGRSEAPKGHFGQQQGAWEVLWHLCGTCAVELVFAGVACGASMQGGCSPQQMLRCWSLQHNIYCACTSASSGRGLRTQAIVRLAIARGAWKWRRSPRPELCSCATWLALISRLRIRAGASGLARPRAGSKATGMRTRILIRTPPLPMPMHIGVLGACAAAWRRWGTVGAMRAWHLAGPARARV